MGIGRHWTNDLRELESTIPKPANIPTLMVWESADPAVHAHSAEQMRRHFKRCELVRLSGRGTSAGRVPDEFNATLLEFLRDLNAQSRISAARKSYWSYGGFSMQLFSDSLS